MSENAIHPQEEADHESIPRDYIVVFVSLLILLALTVGAAFIDWSHLTAAAGRWSLICAIGIAAAKTLLIVLYFMHVRRAPARIMMFAAAGFIWLALMIGLTMCDYAYRADAPAATRVPAALR